MHLKDYYSILELEPSATLSEIKKKYRKLALQFHPDKNYNDPYAAAKFTEIKEAYEVLTDPTKKEYYLQQRWYNQSIGKRKTQTVITPVSVLQQSLELEKYVSKLDVFRMDKAGLQEYILGMLSNSTIEQLHTFHETATIHEIISILLRAIKPLPVAYIDDIITQLQKLAGNDTDALSSITHFIELHKKQSRREKHTLTIIVIVTIIICLLIYVAGR